VAQVTVVSTNVVLFDADQENYAFMVPEAGLEPGDFIGYVVEDEDTDPREDLVDAAARSGKLGEKIWE
jgi:hypothetical protein